MKDFIKLNRNIKICIYLSFLSTLAYGAVYSSIAIYYNNIFGSALTGILLGISAVIGFLMGLLSGNLSDRFGRKRLLILGAICQIIGSIIVIFFNSMLIMHWMSYFGFLIISSVGSTFLITVTGSLIIDSSNRDNQQFAFSLEYWAINISIMIGAGFSALLFRNHFLDLLFLLLIISILDLSLILFVSEYQIILKTNEGSFINSYKEVIKNKKYMMYLLSTTSAMVVIQQFEGMIPIHLSENFETITLFGATIYGQRMLTINLTLGCLLVIFFMGYINGKIKNISHRFTFMSGTILMGAGIVFMLLTNQFIFILIAEIVYTIGELLYTPVSQVIGAELLDRNHVGSYMGINAIRIPIASLFASFMVSILPLVGMHGESLILTFLVIISNSLMNRTQKK